MGKMTGKKSYGKIDHFPVIFTGDFSPMERVHFSRHFYRGIFPMGKFTFPSFLHREFFAQIPRWPMEKMTGKVKDPKKKVRVQNLNLCEIQGLLTAKGKNDGNPRPSYAKNSPAKNVSNISQRPIKGKMTILDKFFCPPIKWRKSFNENSHCKKNFPGKMTKKKIPFTRANLRRITSTYLLLKRHHIVT